MTALAGRAVDQLADLLGAAERLGLMYGDGDPWRRPPHVLAVATVAALVDNDPRLAAGGAQTVMEAVVVPLDHLSDGWWHSPLGILVAATRDDADDDWITQRLAGDALGVSVDTVRRWADAGRVATRAGGPTGGRLVSRRDVSALVVERQAAS